MRPSAFITLFLLFLMMLTACDSRSREEKNGEGKSDEPLATTDSTSRGMPVYEGRLYSSGLSGQEAEKLGFRQPVYQISGRESFFFSAADSLEAYVGHCIKLQAVEKWSPAQESVNEQYTYQRGALEVSVLSLQPPDQCSRFGNAEDRQAMPAREPEVFRGTIDRRERPAPDIAYDYALLLEEPYLDENHPVEGKKMVHELPLFVAEAAEIMRIEEAVEAGKRVLVEGVREQGYAESTVLRVLSVLEM